MPKRKVERSNFTRTLMLDSWKIPALRFRVIGLKILVFRWDHFNQQRLSSCCCYHNAQSSNSKLIEVFLFIHCMTLEPCSAWSKCIIHRVSPQHRMDLFKGMRINGIWELLCGAECGGMTKSFLTSSSAIMFQEPGEKIFLFLICERFWTILRNCFVPKSTT